MICKPLSARHLTDEMLFERAKNGDDLAVTALYLRYYRNRLGYAELLLPECIQFFDESMIHDAFTNAFCNALAKYEVQTAKFRTFFRSIFRNSLLTELNTRNRLVGFQSVKSFDETYYGKAVSNPSEYSLHDIIADGDCLRVPSRSFESAEGIAALEEIPASFPPLTLPLVRLTFIEGYSIGEAARKLHIKRDRARYLIERYRNWVIRHKDKFNS